MTTHVWIAECLFTIILTLSAASTGVARPKGGIWEVRETPMPSQRVNFAASAVNAKIFLIGGTVWDQLPRNGKVLRTVEEYDPATNRWKRRVDMRIGRSDLASSVVNGKIYAIGGSVQVGWRRKHVEQFDPATDTWETKADMLEPRSNFSSNVVDGKIYVLGGSVDGLSETYDPAANNWERIATMPKQRSWFATSVVDEKIYAIGGVKWNPEKYLGTVEVYDPAADTWEKKADMPTARCCLSAITVNGIIYAIGGSNTRALTTVEAYNPASDTWEQMADMPEARGSFSATAINEKIYVFTDTWNFTRTVLIYTPPFRPPQSVDATGKSAITWGRVKAER